MKNKFYLFLLLAFTIGYSSCQEADHQSEKTDDRQPEAIQVLEDGDLNIPVYNEDALEYYLNKKDGKTHIVNFWATWCAPCVKELPYFEQVNEEFKDDNVEVTLVSLDFEQQLEDKLLPYVKRNLKSDVIVVLPENEQEMIRKVSKNWQTGAIPATLIYNDVKRYFIEGETTYEELTTHIEKFK